MGSYVIVLNVAFLSYMRRPSLQVIKHLTSAVFIDWKLELSWSQESKMTRRVREENARLTAMLQASKYSNSHAFVRRVHEVEVIVRPFLGPIQLKIR